MSYAEIYDWIFDYDLSEKIPYFGMIKDSQHYFKKGFRKYYWIYH